MRRSTALLMMVLLEASAPCRITLKVSSCPSDPAC